MSFDRPTLADETTRGPSVIHPNIAYDPFSAALRTFSQGLTRLTINSACLSAGMFWPSSNENQDAMPTWPNMRSFMICFDRMAPDGSWYFIDRGIIHDSHPTRRRVYPDLEMFDPFFAAFTKAVLSMPKLEYFCFAADFPDDYFAVFRIECNVWDTSGGAGPDARTVDFRYEGKTSWVPPSETMEMLRTLGQDRFGGPLVEKFSGGDLYESDESMDDTSDDSTDESTDGSEDE